MQLYFSPFACSLASHITAREAGIALDLVAVTLSTKRTAAGDDFFAVSPKGQVPTLRLDDGSILTENAAVLQYLADAAPATSLLPAPGTADRYRVLEWLNYVGTEVHKACYATMFTPHSPPEARLGRVESSTRRSTTSRSNSRAAPFWWAGASASPMRTSPGP